MNAGLGNLSTLKSRLLPPQSVAQTDDDAEITAIGLGVARWFEQTCDRKFERIEGDTYLCRSDRTYLTVPRYPLESVTTIEQLPIGQAAWTPAPPTWLLFPESGLIDFAATLGTPYTQLRLTYTGGYWWDETEDASGVQPMNSHPLPLDLHFAWLDQCAFLYERRTKLGLQKIAHLGGTYSLEPTDLLPHVRAILQNYRRHALT